MYGCFFSRQINGIINKFNERALTIVLKDHISEFETLQQKSNDISSHCRNIQTLMIQVYKIKNELAPSIMYSMLNRRNVICNIKNL